MNKVIQLPYKKDELEPYMSSETIDFHYEKHHKGYMKKLEGLISGTSYESKDLLDIIKTSNGSIFDNAAQVWNHNFWWKSMRPKGGGPPNDSIVKKMVADYGGWEKLRGDLIEKSMSQFGSGWGWIVLSNEKLKIITTSNAKNPLTSDDKPLITVDLWEHAYYIDKRNSRKEFLESFCDNLLNWSFLIKNLT